MMAAMPELPQQPATTPDASGENREFTIDELAAETQVPSRTIRFYQSKKALPAPERRGRKAIYTQEHAERLRLIARLQDQGLTIKAIRDVLSRADKGELELGDWLGLKNHLQAPWADDAPRVVTRAELFELTGTSRDGLISDLVRAEIIARSGDVFSVPSPALLKIAMRLERAGIDLSTSADATKMLRRHLAKAATEVSRHFLSQMSESAAGPARPARIGEAFATLRPVGLEVVQLIFAQEMEKSLRKAVESGKVTQAVRRSS
jgi:DNA-binding transcriptional MerR regulator